MISKHITKTKKKKRKGEQKKKKDRKWKTFSMLIFKTRLKTKIKIKKNKNIIVGQGRPLNIIHHFFQHNYLLCSVKRHAKITYNFHARNVFHETLDIGVWPKRYRMRSKFSKLDSLSKKFIIFQFTSRKIRNSTSSPYKSVLFMTISL